MRRTPQAQDAASLQDILGAYHAGATTRQETHSTVIDLILERVQCARVSFWKFVADDGRLSLLCFASKAAGEVLDTSDRRLHAAQYHDYYETLVKTGSYASSDALADPLLAPMRDAYLAPNRIVSLLDTAFLLNSRAYGRVCCEETRVHRQWSAADVVAVRGIVNKLALLMWNAPASVLPTSPSLDLHLAPPPVPPQLLRRRS